jgi:hypothetical protein
MRMTVIFTVFALLAGLASLLMPHIAPGLGLDMMLAYLALALISAVLGLLRRPARRDD